MTAENSGDDFLALWRSTLYNSVSNTRTFAFIHRDGHAAGDLPPTIFILTGRGYEYLE